MLHDSSFLEVFDPTTNTLLLKGTLFRTAGTSCTVAFFDRVHDVVLVEAGEEEVTSFPA